MNVRDLPQTPEVSFVIPVKNEAAAIDRLFAALLPVARDAAASFEIVVVNDGSTDATLEALRLWQARCPQLRLVDLSRNFGKEAALTAGLQVSRGSCAITMDADLQDPPDVVPRMIQKWKEGFETVVAVHRERRTDALLKRGSARFFYWIVNMMSDTKFIPDAGDFRLLDRVVVKAFLSLPERTRLNKGLFAWVGFRQHFIEHERPPREQGKSAFTLRKLISLAIEGITSFSIAPLRVATVAGFVIAAISFVLGLRILVRTLVYGIDVPGYASIMVTVMFLGSVNLISVGVLGEYLGRVFLESKQRPLYIIRQILEPQDSEKGHE